MGIWMVRRGFAFNVSHILSFFLFFRSLCHLGLMFALPKFVAEVTSKPTPTPLTANGPQRISIKELNALGAPHAKCSNNANSDDASHSQQRETIELHPHWCWLKCSSAHWSESCMILYFIRDVHYCLVGFCWKRTLNSLVNSFYPVKQNTIYLRDSFCRKLINHKPTHCTVFVIRIHRRVWNTCISVIHRIQKTPLKWHVCVATDSLANINMHGSQFLWRTHAKWSFETSSVWTRNIFIYYIRRE